MIVSPSGSLQGYRHKWRTRVILVLVLVLVVPYYVHFRRLLGSHARIPRAPRRGGGRWRGSELDRAGGVLRRGRVGRCVASGRGVERNQEEDVRVQQERHAFCVDESVRADVWKGYEGKAVLCQRRLTEEREIFALGEGVDVPEHDEDVCDVVHATVVDVV